MFDKFSKDCHTKVISSAYIKNVSQRLLRAQSEALPVVEDDDLSLTALQTTEPALTVG